MTLIVLVVHLVICIGLVFLVLLQRSEGGALGVGGGGGGSLMSGRGAADALAKLTQIAGGMFLATSLLLTVLSGAARTDENRSVLDNVSGGFGGLFGGGNEISAPASTAPPASNTLDISAPAPASVTPAPASETIVAPAPASGAERAGPVTAAPAPRQTAAPATTTRQATNTTTRPPATNTGAATTAPRTTTNPPAALTPTEVAPAAPESSETPTGVEVVRRDRAGPDQ